MTKLQLLKAIEAMNLPDDAEVFIQAANIGYGCNTLFVLNSVLTQNGEIIVASTENLC